MPSHSMATCTCLGKPQRQPLQPRVSLCTLVQGIACCDNCSRTCMPSRPMLGALRTGAQSSRYPASLWQNTITAMSRHATQNAAPWVSSVSTVRFTVSLL